MSPVGTCLIAKARFRIGLSESLSNPCTRSMAFVDGTVSSLMSRLCVCFLTSASWSERKSMRPIVSALTTCWTSLTLCPGVAVSASSRNLTSRSQSCCTTCVYACLPLARCASSITRHTTSFAGHTPSLMSLSIVCGVQKKTRFSRHSERRVPSTSFLVLPISVHVSSVGMPQMSLHAAFCWSTRGRVGAKNTTLPEGNQR